MKVIEAAEKEAQRICQKYIKDRDDVAALTAMRDTTKSTILFYFLLERFMAKIENANATPSKALLKYYMKSPVKENEDQAYYGDETEQKDQVQLIEGVQITKGLLLRLLERAKLWKTYNTYVKFLVLNDSELNGEYFSQDDKKYAELDAVIEVLYNEAQE